MQTMTDRAILVQHLTYRYGKAERAAVDDLSFSVDRGEVVGLLGPNGAGKTTTLHAILGLLEPTGGRVEVFGASPLRQRLQVLPRLNFASADVDLPSNLLVAECLRVFAKLYQVPEPGRRVDELIERLELVELRRHRIGSLSSGEQMRLKLCKALVNSPQLLVLEIEEIEGHYTNFCWQPPGMLGCRLITGKKYV